jgi:hypothetical protein
VTNAFLQSKQEETLTTKDSVWTGPFIRIGPAFSEKRLYFNQLFGNKCYESSKGESWCFGSGYIEVSSHDTYSTELVLDPTEMPNYGFSVFARGNGDKNEHLWVFKRDGDGWQIFEEHPNSDNRFADKSIKKPWRVLKPQPR